MAGTASENLTSKNNEPLKASARDEVIKYIQEKNIQFVDLWFTDVPGKTQYYGMSARQFLKEVQEDGGHFRGRFDGSSIRGFQTIDESDMVLAVDWSTGFRLPYAERPSISLRCNAEDPFKGAYDNDPRTTARKAAEYLKSTGIADTAHFGPELEFFIFDQVAYNGNPDAGDLAFRIMSEEAAWNTGFGRGHKIPPKHGYFPLPPDDKNRELRHEMVALLEAAGIEIEAVHHEVATAGQAEIDMKYAPLLQMADQVMLYKYITKNVAERYGKTVTFMPKPLLNDNGSGMHVHFSLWKDEKPLFADERGYAGLSDTAKHALGGLLKHAPAILAFAAPTINSYRRLVPGFEAPVNLVYSKRNRSAAIRIPQYHGNRFSPSAVRLEFRCPDPSSNPYLVFSAMLMAAIDGIENKIDPGKPVDKDIYELKDKKSIPSTPGSLEETLQALEADAAFLTQGGVFAVSLLGAQMAWAKGMVNEHSGIRRTALEKLGIKDNLKETELKEKHPKEFQKLQEMMLGVEAEMYYAV